METLYESEYQTIKFDRNKNIIFYILNTKQDMTDEEYRKEFDHYAKIITKYKPANVFLDSKKARYVIPVETHEWLANKINPLYELYKVKKVAVIMSTDFITNLSNELIAEELEQPSIQTQYFDDEEKAIDWLQCNENTQEKAA